MTRPRTLLVALLGLGLSIGLAPLGPLAGAAGRERPTPPAPILWSGAVGDPSVVEVGRRLVVMATGPQVRRAYKDPGRRWRWTAPVLSKRPVWAKRGDIWAADLARVEGRWTLYYSVPVAGLGRYGRCIGVAVASRPLAVFRPVGAVPLVCPRRAKVPAAQDRVKGSGMPSKGIIDPSLYVEKGRPYLLYKTDGVPSSIRLLPLSRNGRNARGSADAGRPSIELVRSDGVIENPVLMRRDDVYYLFASEGDFARCSYRQTWRASSSLTAWQDAVPGVLLDRALTGGLCGPAGGDVVVNGERTTLYFHGWVRRGTTRPKGRKFRAWHRRHDGQRAMYAALLRFRGGVPTVARYLK